MSLLRTDKVTELDPKDLDLIKQSMYRSRCKINQEFPETCYEARRKMDEISTNPKYQTSRGKVFIHSNFFWNLVVLSYTENLIAICTVFSELIFDGTFTRHFGRSRPPKWVLHPPRVRIFT